MIVGVLGDPSAQAANETAGLAGIASRGLAQSNMSNGQSGLSRGSIPSGRARTGIDNRGHTRDVRGLTRHRFRARYDRVRFRSRGNRIHALSSPYLYRRPPSTNIRIYLLPAAPAYRITTVSPTYPSSGNSVCRESARRLCIATPAEFDSVEVLCDLHAHRFETRRATQPMRFSCPSGLISSVWAGRPGSGPGEGAGLSVHVQTSGCPVPSPCGGRADESTRSVKP